MSTAGQLEGASVEVFEYRCAIATEADCDETGWRPVRCGAPAAAVSRGNDEGVCGACLTDMRLAGAMALATIPDVIDAGRAW